MSAQIETRSWLSEGERQNKAERRARWEEKNEAEDLRLRATRRAVGELLKKTMGEWLGTLAPWDVFSTWTFGWPIGEQGAMFWAGRHLKYLEKMAEQPVYAFVGVERGQRGGLLHIHALVGNVAHLKTYCGSRLVPGNWAAACCMLHAWPCGIARVWPYDPTLGARFYLSRYVVKGLAEWKLIGFPADPQKTFELAPRPQRRRGRSPK